jgi:DNA-binding NtrC family response regulator
MDNTTVEQKRHAILLIEDDKVDQEAFIRLIEDQDLPYACTIAASVSEARSILGREIFDVIITDYSLGDGTTFDILDFVNNTPIIVITGTEGVVINSSKVHVCDSLIKDIERNYLKVLPGAIEKAIRYKMAESRG